MSPTVITLIEDTDWLRKPEHLFLAFILTDFEIVLQLITESTVFFMKTEIISMSFFKLLFQPSVVACFFLNYFLFSDCPFSQPCFGNPLWSSFLLQFFTYFYAHIQIKDLRKHWFHPHFFLGTIAILQRLPVLWHSTGVNLRFSICITCSGHINVYTNGNIIIIYIVL